MGVAGEPQAAFGEGAADEEAAGTLGLNLGGRRRWKKGRRKLSRKAAVAP
jgi:hypothetical protein